MRIFITKILPLFFAAVLITAQLLSVIHLHNHHHHCGNTEYSEHHEDLCLLCDVTLTFSQSDADSSTDSFHRSEGIFLHSHSFSSESFAATTHGRAPPAHL